ncbi:hypothetical protein ACHMW7_15965 [Aminobacter sp. UC22_36]|uniref:hypothetical protein n=1 Tax=Aminobacter sp. UC22_36 TaxID=3374549 RepID=UPI003756DFB7
MGRRVETEKLIEFAREMCRVAFDGGDMDGWEIQETAERYGLIEAVRYDPKLHTNVANAEYCRPGDIIYVFAGPLASPAPVTQKDKAE